MTVKYEIKVKLKPAEPWMTASAVLTFPAGERRKPLTAFYLHRNLTPERIEADGVPLQAVGTEESDIQFVPEARKYLLPDGLVPRQLLIQYGGAFSGLDDSPLNRIDPGHIELGLYSPWYPLLGLGMATECSAVLTGVSDYVFAGGRKENGVWHIDTAEPGGDCLLLGYRDPQIHHTDSDGASATIYSGSDDGCRTASLIAGGMNDILACSADYMGAVEDKAELIIAVMPRRKNGGYARRGVVVLSEMDSDRAALLKYLAHEIGHFWFCGAETLTWEDWLNESFTEYFSLLYLETYHGQGAYDRIVAEYNDQTAALPPVRGIERSDPAAHTVLYRKGALILHGIREVYGDSGLRSLFRTLLDLPERTTAALLQTLRETGRQDLADRLDSELNK